MIAIDYLCSLHFSKLKGRLNMSCVNMAVLCGCCSVYDLWSLCVCECVCVETGLECFLNNMEVHEQIHACTTLSVNLVLSSLVSPFRLV